MKVIYINNKGDFWGGITTEEMNSLIGKYAEVIKSHNDKYFVKFIDGDLYGYRYTWKLAKNFISLEEYRNKKLEELGI